MSKTYLMFIDASGDPGKYTGSNTKYYVLSGLILRPDKWYKVYNGVINILRTFFSDIDKIKRPELHYHDIRQGKGIYGRLSCEEKKKLADMVYDLILGSESTLLAIIVDKVRYYRKYKKPEPVKLISFQYIMDRYERFLRKRNAYGILVYDYEGKQDKYIRELLERSRILGSVDHIYGISWRYKRIIETIFFTESETSIGLQLADFVAYAVFSCWEHNKCSRFNQLFELFDRRPYGDPYNYGIKVIP